MSQNCILTSVLIEVTPEEPEQGPPVGALVLGAGLVAGAVGLHAPAWADFFAALGAMKERMLAEVSFARGSAS